mgnify:CR=1 FL=1
MLGELALGSLTSRYFLGEGVCERAAAWKDRGGRVELIRVVIGHRPIGRVMAEFSEKVVGTIPKQSQIPSPYSYSPTHPVWEWHGLPVIIVETKHRRYEIFRVYGPLDPPEED